MNMKKKSRSKPSNTKHESTIPPSETIESCNSECIASAVNSLDSGQTIGQQDIPPTSFYHIGEENDDDNDETSKPLTINTKLDMIYNSLAGSNYHTNNDQI